MHIDISNIVMANPINFRIKKVKFLFYYLGNYAPVDFNFFINLDKEFFKEKCTASNPICYR